jgi:hypothetical protein
MHKFPQLVCLSVSFLFYVFEQLVNVYILEVNYQLGACMKIV